MTSEQHARAVEQNMRIYALQKARGALAIIGLTGAILFAGYWSYGKMVLFPVALGGGWSPLRWSLISSNGLIRSAEPAASKKAQ